MERARLRRLLMTAAASCAALLLSAPLLAKPQQISLPVTVNDVPKGEMLVAVDGDDVVVRVADLARLGIAGESWNRLLNISRTMAAPVEIDGGEAVSLRTLDPFVKYVVNPEDLSLAITVSPRLLGATEFAIRDPRPLGIIYPKDRTAFFNYVVSAAELKRYGGFAETGVTMPRGLFYSSVLKTVDQPLTRGLTNFVKDDLKKLRRWTIGDGVAYSGDVLGGGALVGGVTLTRNFNLDPYFIRFPSMSLTGTALTPSRVDVYVNGVLVAQQDVPPGPFELRNLQVTPGAGTTRLVVRDAFGREQVQATSYYYSTTVLARGLSEYTYSAGLRRERYGIANFDYGDPAALAFHRVGLKEWLTAGGRAEASSGLFSGGPLASVRTRAGDFGVSAGVSTDHGDTGMAGSLGYSYLTRRYSFGAQMRAMSDHYATLSMPKAVDRPLRDVAVFGSLGMRFGSFAAEYRTTDMRDTASNTRLSLLAAFMLHKGVSLVTSVASVDNASGRHGEYFAGASFSIGRSTSASAGFSGSGPHHEANFNIQKALPIGTGLGYRVDTVRREDGSRTGNASLQYQAPFGRYELSGDLFQSRVKPTFTVAGGVVYAAGALKLAPPVQESYALVEVPDVAGVRVYASNQLIGRTDSRGKLLVPNLLAYYGNELRIEDRDVPMTHEVGAVERTLAPPYRGGGVVVFPVKQHRSITGSLVVIKAEKNVSPALGTFTIKGRDETWESPIGRGGEFELEDVPTGTYEATIEYRDGTCTFRLTVPPGDNPNLGQLTCPAR